MFACVTSSSSQRANHCLSHKRLMTSPETWLDEDTLKSLADRLRNQQLEESLAIVRSAVQEGDARQVIMAMPMLLALAICPAMLGTQEAIRQSQSKNKREEHRARRCNLITSCVKPSIRSRDINGRLVILRDSKLYIANEPPPRNLDEPHSMVSGHPFAGYFLPYPDSQYEGVVSTICEEPPILNWMYVDKDTYEVKYGLRVEAQPHITGPFDCTAQDRRMTLEGWEGFVAVEEYPGTWALYFDRDDDGLRSKVPLGTRVLEIELTRREKKEPKPKPDPRQAQTLDEMMKQHKERIRKEEAEKEEFKRREAEQFEAAAAAAAAVVQENEAAHPPGREASDLQQHPTIQLPALDGLSISHGKAADAGDAGGILSPNPSIRSDAPSMWSLASRKDGGLEDTASVTVATSISEREQLAEGFGYKKPYVEDAAEVFGRTEYI
ncbi:hypothetical protein S40288_02795 [Stachybotrys chartarum IBT 40288]|nr:hypothetical protein S40288_02795 [Stachybotrys chartarum IBT 40288]